MSLSTYFSCNADTPSKLLMKMNGDANQPAFRGFFYMHVEEAVRCLLDMQRKLLPTA